VRYRLTEALRRLLACVQDQSLDRELEAEMQSHLDFAIEENLRRGLSPEEARRQALVSFGGAGQAKEHHREARGLPTLNILMQDLRYAFRTLRRDRAFALIAVLILAVGIGANIAVFSLANTILLHPLPFRNAQQLTWLAGNKGVGGLSDQTYRVDVYEAISRNSRSFQEVTAYEPNFELSEFKLTGLGEPRPVSGVSVAGDFFQVLGVQPLKGRLFTREDCIKGGRLAVVLTHAFWERQFAADPAILGKAITLDSRPFTVVGVLPEAFDFSAVFEPGLKVDIFVPIVMDQIRTVGHMLSLVGRLRSGVTPSQAQTEVIQLLSHDKGASNPDWSTDLETTITGLQDHVTGKLQRSLIVLWCGVGLILLIVFVNLSNLLLARAATRQKEFAMRIALGAGRGRLIRQLMTESLILSGAGALLGLGFAFAAIRYLAHQGSIALPLLSSVTIDKAALGWTLAIALATGILFGLVPALGISVGNLQDTLKSTRSGLSLGRKHERIRAALVVAEVSLACTLLIGAGLLLRSFLRVLDVDLGFQPSRAAAISVDYEDGGNRQRRGAILKEILDRVTAIPGVESAGMSDKLPLDRNRSWDLRAKGRAYPRGWNDDAFVYVVTPGYLRSMGMHLRSGRDFTWQDSATRGPVIIINQAAARRDWPGEDPLGRLAQGFGYGETRVIGIISDVRDSGLEETPNPEVYVPATQAQPDGENLVVRTKVPPQALASSVLKTLRALNPGQPAAEFRPLQRLVDHSVSPRRFFVALVTCFAVLGLVLASLGIYGVISYSVSRRTQEIGVRMALGATAPKIEFEVIAKTLRLTLFGIALGIVTSRALSRVVASLLFETASTDAATFATMFLLVNAVALLAGYIPARRASRVDPLVALRAE
jgi:predicted permease